MKTLIALFITAFALTSFAADKVADKPAETNCVKKDKKGNCPPPPKSPKPTPKKKDKDK
jgi:hypothetical protein